MSEDMWEGRISIVQKICHCHCAEIVIYISSDIWQFLRNGNDKSSELLISWYVRRRDINSSEDLSLPLRRNCHMPEDMWEGRISIVQRICHCHCAEIVIYISSDIWQFLRNGNDKSSELLISWYVRRRDINSSEDLSLPLRRNCHMPEDMWEGRISIVQKICHCHCAEIVICQKICEKAGYQ